MSTKSKKPSENTVETLNLAREITIYPSEKFLYKMQETCAYINDREWSGHLYYTVEEGKVTTIELLDFFLDDISEENNRYWTSSEVSTEEFQYMEENDLLLGGIQRGFVHSHVNLDTFFSSQDVTDLKEGGNLNTTYLSVIVNNRSEINAKFCERIDTEIPSKVVTTRGGLSIRIPKKKISYLTITDCDIVVEELPEVPISPILLRINEIHTRKAAQRAAAIKQQQFFNHQNQNYGNANGSSKSKSTRTNGVGSPWSAGKWEDDWGGISRWNDK